MRNRTYFKKTGQIYGVIGFCFLGDWIYDAYIFEDFDEAEEWRDVEKPNQSRELMSKTGAVKLCGKSEFKKYEPPVKKKRR